jgi:phosphatidylinositol-bisphosphatase
MFKYHSFLFLLTSILAFGKLTIACYCATQKAVLPAGYECIASAQLIGILMLVFVSPSIAPLISSVSTTTVGTGVMGYIGNKGGVGVRVVLGDTLRLAFVTCHLAAFSQAVDRRNWDANEILRRMWFEGVAKDVVGFERLEDDGVELNSATAGENLEKSDVLIWCGDLNYRLDLDNRDVRALLQPFMPKDLPPTHADGTSPSLPQEESPPSTPKFSPTPGEAHPSALATLEGTVESLLKHDQLHRVRREGKAFKGFKEGKISFIPTYKYDVGTMGKWDSGEKARVPSWCDRVMWRVKGSLEEERRGIDLADINKGRDRSSSVLSLPAPDEVLFETQDDSDSDEEDLVVSRAEEPVPPQKKAKTVKPMYDNPTAVVSTYFGDIRIKQERYTSHQNITSSDHKPISATFDLSFPAVDPERRAKVSADIVREVDRLENERRPVVTVVIEQPDSSVASDALEDGGNIINFGDVRFWEKKHTLIMVANTGTSQAKIRFVSRPGGKDSGVKEVICQPWMTVDVSSPAGMKKDPKRLHNAELEPGDTVNIDIYLLIESLAHARALNEKKKSLEDVLIMRVEGGRDVFLPVSAKWLYTSYGTTLKELVRIPEDAGGFRGFRKQLEERPSLKSGEDSSPTFSAPRQINHITTFLLDTLRETVATLRPDERLEEKPWFSHLGWPFVRETWHNIDSERRRKIEVGIWEALDTDADFGHVKIQRVAMTDGEEDPTKEELVEATTAVFLQWLEGLSDGIVPASLWQDIAKAGDAKTMEQVFIFRNSSSVSAGILH